MSTISISQILILCLLIFLVFGDFSKILSKISNVNIKNRDKVVILKKKIKKKIRKKGS